MGILSPLPLPLGYPAACFCRLPDVVWTGKGKACTELLDTLQRVIEKSFSNELTDLYLYL